MSAPAPTPAPPGRRRHLLGWLAFLATLTAAVVLMTNVLSTGNGSDDGAGRSAADAAALPAPETALTLNDKLRDAWHSASLTGVPEEYRGPLAAAAVRCPQLPTHLLAAQLEVESTWDPQAVSYAGAEGLAQFLPSTWEMFGTDADGDGTADPYDPVDAIHSAAVYNCDLLRRTASVPGDPFVAMFAAYHAGPGAVVAAGGVPPIAATQVYVARIMATVLRMASETG